MICPSCRGDGSYLTAPPGDRGLEPSSDMIEVQCPDCDGTGRIELCPHCGQRRSVCRHRRPLNLEGNS